MTGWDIDHLIKMQQIKSQSRRHRAETEMKNDTVPNKMPADLQSFPEAIYESLEQGLIVGNGLEYVSIGCHVSDGPLAQPSAAQSEDVTEERHKRCEVCCSSVTPGHTERKGDQTQSSNVHVMK